MEEFDQGLSRLELLKRGALGAAAFGGVDALLRAEGAAGAASLTAAKRGGKLVALLTTLTAVMALRIATVLVLVLY